MADPRQSENTPLFHPSIEMPDLTFAEQAKMSFSPAVEMLTNSKDAFSKYRGRSASERFRLLICYAFPILTWLPVYKLSYVLGDVIGGLTIASLAVPQDLAFAKLANLPPVNGLYASIVPPIVYAVMGTSRHMAIGPVTVTSALIGNLASKQFPPLVADPSGKPGNVLNPEYYDLVITASFFAGLFEAALGFLRLGFVVDFVSYPALVGFLGGAAFTIGGGQMKGFLGYSNFTTKTQIVEVIKSIIDFRNQFQWRAFTIGITFLVFLLTVKILAKRHKGSTVLFALNASGPLLSVVFATLAVFLTKADEKYGLKTVGHVRKGINPSSLHNIRFDGSFAEEGVKIGIVAAIVALTEAIAIGRTFAALEGYQIDGNREMIALGLGNVFGSFSSSYVATGSMSRTAVNYAAGAKTAVSNIIMSIVIILTILVITPLFQHLPNAVLASIIISALSGLVDVAAACEVWKEDKFDFIVLLGTFFGVLFISVEIGLLIALSISGVKILLQISRPRVAVMGHVPQTDQYRDMEECKTAIATPGVLILHIGSSICFANANFIRDEVLRMVECYDDKSEVPLQFVACHMAAVDDVDTTGTKVLREIFHSLHSKGIVLGFAHTSTCVLWKFKISGLSKVLGEESFYFSIDHAVQIARKHFLETREM